MPEGDTAFRTAERLAHFLVGQHVTEFDLRVPAFATADLRGEVIHAVFPRGKHLLMHIGDFSLHSHLKMEGRWHVYPTGERWRAPAYQARAVVGTAAHQAVGFEVAGVALVPTAEEGTLVDYLGPDPLSAIYWDIEEAATRVSRDARAVHVALLDQRNVAGFGNEYVNEILFVGGVDPHTPATEVDAPHLLGIGYRMIHANLHRSRRVFTGDSRAGKETWVFGRERKPCRRCRTPILLDHLGADPTKLRNVFWCPRCQT